MGDYKVITMTNSVAASETFKRSPNSFDLVITDMTMPKITGYELAKEMLIIRPDIPIILCTGYSESIDAENAKDAGIKGFVMKPVLKEDLVAAIRKAIDSQS